MILLCGLTFWCSSRVDAGEEMPKEKDPSENDTRGRTTTSDESRAQRSESGSLKATRSNKAKEE